ncbi:hypothetical protein AFLA70_746g000301, partial [Aspergillus flavus AF70]
TSGPPASAEQARMGSLKISSSASSPVKTSRAITYNGYAEDESFEDLFGAFLAYLFPDDGTFFHGDPGQNILYSSPRYGALEIERIYEQDLNFGPEDGKQVRRDWVPEREGEGPKNRRRWCVIALHKKKGRVDKVAWRCKYPE